MTARRFDGVRVLVLRALMLGDLLCATPALRALRAAMPGARISLLGLPAQRGLAERLASVDEHIDFPGWPGLPETEAPGPVRQYRFVAAMRRRRFDLAVQLHGSGSVVNPLLASLGASHLAGFHDGRCWRPTGPGACFIAWPDTGTEVERLLALTDAMGLARQGSQLDFPVRAEDRRALLQRWPQVQDRPLAVVHAGSQLPSRRWPVERFAAVGDALVERGLAVVLTGGSAELALTTRVAQAMRHPALNLAGGTTLWTLGALLERSRLLVSNDTGLSHVAAALAIPSVVVSSGADALRWSPHDVARHTVLWHPTACRPCAHAQCPEAGHPCATGVSVQSVLDAADRALRTGPGPWPTGRPEPCPGATHPTSHPDHAPCPAACESSPGTSTATTCTT